MARTDKETGYITTIIMLVLLDVFLLTTKPWC